MLLKSMLSITRVCIICSDLSKFHWHTEGVAGNNKKKKKGEKKKKKALRYIYCCTLAVPRVLKEFAKPGPQSDAGRQLANVGGTRELDKDSFRYSPGEKKTSFHAQHSTCKSGLEFAIIQRATALQVVDHM